MNPFDLMKNLSKLQGQLSSMQDKMKDIRALGSAGGDLVQIVVNGQFEVTKVTLDPEVLQSKDLGVLQDLLTAAFNDGVAKVKEKVKESMGAAGIAMPPGFPGV